MIELQSFIPIVRAAIPSFQIHAPNPNQQACIIHPPETPLMIVAGPGSGKTTVLVLRALRLVFVNDYMPEQIILTTFTRKAAAEIRARLIEWGLSIITYLRNNPPAGATADFHTWLNSIDINRFITGTLDSICEEVLTTYRDPNDSAPVLVENFVGNALLMFKGLFPSGGHPNPTLDTYLAPFNFDGSPPANFGEKLAICRTIINRLTHDLVNINAYSGGAPHTQARTCIIQAANAYWLFLNNTNRMDYSQLERIFHERLVQVRLIRFTAGVQAVLVDEYQDTNPLQESIYFELIRQTNASFTIVGDDDQSLYRFRGATVELFRDFVARFIALVPGLPGPQIQYLVENYRSTPEIVTFFNNFIQYDPGFASARVQPPKPLIVPKLPSNGIPILGMFRPDCATLADDLVSFLGDVFRGPGRTIRLNGQQITIERDPNGGDFGDCVFLSRTVNEYTKRFENTPPRERLPKLLRDRLLAQLGVAVFNPRGRALRDIPIVQQLLGTILECIDPPTAACLDGQQQAAINPHLRSEARRHLTQWRQAARDFIATNPLPNQPRRLQDFVAAWQSRTSQTHAAWPEEWPLLELCFKILTWMPELHNDPEGQVYLEAITRCLSQAATFSSYRSTIYFGQAPHDINSVQRAILEAVS